MGARAQQAYRLAGNTGPEQAILTATLFPWLGFMLCIVVIGLGGYHMSRNADAIALQTGLSRTWIGLLLLSVATSLPELITGVSAIRFAGLPDIAAGDALGSCVFNLVILVVLDALSRKRPLYATASPTHALTAGLGIVLLGYVALSMLLPASLATLRVGHIGLYTPVILVAYLVSVRVVYLYETRSPHTGGVASADARLPRLHTAVLRYAGAATLVVVAGTALPFSAEAVAAVMGWSQTFMGTVFVAFSTSVPELAVTISAFRLGALDMAIANLLGSNLFDVAILAIDDLVYLDGPLLAAVSPTHALTALSAVIMSGIAVIALFYRSTNRLFRFIGWPGFLLLGLYVLNSVALSLHGS